jgi:nitrite reductase (NADH) large subunit
MEDVLAIRSHVLAHPSSASVIGGGLLGLEAACALKDAGAETVRVFELFPRLLPRQLDETGAALLASRFAAMGIEVVCGAETARLEPGLIVLKDGRVFQSATTLLSMGVHSNIELATAAGLEVKRGIVVDERMHTSAPDVYAVGDCAEFGGIVWGIIPAALEQAPVAAKQIVSALSKSTKSTEAPVYVQTVPKTALKIAGIELMSVGKAVPTNEEASAGRYEILMNVWSGGSRYEKYVLAPSADPNLAANNATILVGAILYGSRANQSFVQAHIGKPADTADIARLLDL